MAKRTRTSLTNQLAFFFMPTKPDHMLKEKEIRSSRICKKVHLSLLALSKGREKDQGQPGYTSLCQGERSGFRGGQVEYRQGLLT